MSLTGSAVQREIKDAERRGAREAGERIRKALLDAIESTADLVLLSESGEEQEEPVEMCDKEALLEALDQIIPPPEQ